MDRRRNTEEPCLQSLTDAAGDVVDDKSNARSSVIKLATCAVCGAVFGFAAQKCQVFQPSVIQDQMSMEKFVMMKVFLAATSSSMFSLSLLSMIPATSDAYLQARKCFVRSFVDKGILTSTLGGAVLGAGMTISGACPGMVLIQVGSRVTTAGFTLFGCLFGALVYGVVEPFLTNKLKPNQPYMQNFVYQVQGAPYFTVSLPLAAMVALMVFGLELFVPWQSEIKGLGDVDYIWPPYLSGVIMGMLQVPLVLTIQDTLGGSSGYCTVVSQILVTKQLSRQIPYFARFKSGLANWWQVVFMASAVGGALLSSYNQITPSGVSTAAAFAGGVLMVFGARLASGCTSGHGISGMGLLSLHSLTCVPAMFAGGIAVRLLLGTT